MAWTDEQKAEAIKSYTDGNPTAENSAELIKQIADDLEQSPNGVRMILMQANVYVKKDATATKPGATKPGAKTGEAAKRVSKESQIAALRELIEARGKTADADILDKLTGKAAAYFADVFSE